MKGSMSPGRGSASKRRGLTFESNAVDKAAMGSSWDSRQAHASVDRSRERGQALVEFALIAPLFLLIVVGIIQFGVALNYWLDLNRIANQGARWAVVNKYPGCAGTPPCSPTLEVHMEMQHQSEGNENDVFICFEDVAPGVVPSSAAALVGTPITVTATDEYQFQAIVHQPSLTLKGKATMRIEQPPTVLIDQLVAGCPDPVPLSTGP
jgi:hypothetical protein